MCVDKVGSQLSYMAKRRTSLRPPTKIGKTTNEMLKKKKQVYYVRKEVSKVKKTVNVIICIYIRM